METFALSRNLATWNEFQAELAAQEASIVAMLPRHVPKERFINSAISAVKQTPGLLRCTPRSLFNSITKSAQDGLLPDGREGVITAYREKDGDTWVEKAQWNPMAFGLRKRARELDSIIVDAQVVHENDDFEWDQGDEPKLIHKPAKLGTPRGSMVGAYAIFKNDHGILHREVMDADAIEKVRSQSKSQNGVMWTKFAPEAWRKTVVRRGFKTVPCSETLQSIVQRDDETFSFDETPAAKRKRETVTIEATSGPMALPPVVGQGVAEEQFQSEIAPTQIDLEEAIKKTGQPHALILEHDGPVIAELKEMIQEEREKTKRKKPLPPIVGTTETMVGTAEKEFDSSLWAEQCMRDLRNADEAETIQKIEIEDINPHLSEASPVDVEEVMAVLKEVKDLAGIE